MSKPNGTEFVEGSLVSFNVGDGWRCGYLLKIRETRGDIQPIGAIGKVPAIVVCNLSDMRLEPNQSVKWPTVDDFYRANKRTAPVVLVATPLPVHKVNPVGDKASPPVQKVNQERITTIQNALEAGAGCFTGALNNELAELGAAPKPAPPKKERAGREQIEEMIRAGVSYRKISAACGVSLGHITTVKKEMVTT